MFTCTKKYTDIPFAHRQHMHKGHCALIHGHNWSFEFNFGAHRLDDNGFVVDFGDLKWLKLLIETMFDHALVLNCEDPWLGHLRDVLTTTRYASPDAPCFAKITVVPNCGAEGLAVFLGEEVEKLLLIKYGGRVSLRSLRVEEDAKNSATYTFPRDTCSHV